MTVFLDPQNDYAFKCIFGDERKPEILMSFLNSTLGFSGEQHIDEIRLLNSFQAPYIMGTKETIVDVRCRDHGGHEYIVEMQVLPKDYFDKRILYYATKSYSMQLDRGEGYSRLRRVIFLGVLGFSFSKNADYMAQHTVRDVQSNERILHDLEFNFIELPKFNKKEHELTSLSDKWIYFLQHAGDCKKIPEVFANDADIVAAFEVLRECNWSKEELRLYDNIDMRRMDIFAELEYARKTGEAEGRAIGEAEGKAEGEKMGIEMGMEKGRLAERCELVRKLMAQNIDLAIIAKATSLSIEKLQALQLQKESFE